MGERSDEISRGDVVRLRGTKRLMTVESVSTTGIVHCKWFDETDKLHRDNFSISELRKVK